MAATQVVDAAELLSLLESTDLSVVKQIQELILDNLRGSKEAWLINGLVDSYMMSQSQQCLEILAQVSDHHVKHLFDRLAEHLKGVNKLQVVTVLGSLIQHQPPWMHRVVQHSLTGVLIKCMKNETDVPILLGGLLYLTALLPLVPVAISSVLHDIFDIFLRMATFNLKKPGMSTWAESPMLNTVRMHPLLVTASREKEVSTERWRSLEVHDIMIECSKLSLDPIESSSEGYSCPISDAKAPPLSRPSSNIAEGLVGQVDLSVIWSPSAVCDLSTPPLRSSVTPSEASQLYSPVRMTPQLESPCPPIAQSSETDLKSPLRPTPTSDQKRRKRLSGITLPLSGGQPTPTENVCFFAGGDPPSSGSVPPSPMKPNFTTEPPFNAQKMNAIRKISFHPDDGTAAKVLDASSGSAAANQLQSSFSESTEKAKMLSSSSARDIADSSNGFCDKLSNTPSVHQLPKLINSFEDSTEETDREVDELTRASVGDLAGDSSSSDGEPPSHLPADANLTAASVAAFMKKVNRIRFNTVNVINKPMDDPIVMSRPRSCPDLNGNSSGSCSPMLSGSLPRDRSIVASRTSPKRVEFNTAVMTLTESKTTNTMSSQTSFCLASKEGNTEMENGEWRHFFPYEHLFPLVLPRVCDQSKKEDGPLFATFSPADLLDRHLERCGDVHAKQVGNLPLPARGAVSWTHFGGLPPADELTILQGQLLLMHNQLMFERHRRDLHAKRNRRLLSRIVKTTSMEEQNTAMRDQLQLQEKEIQTLSASIKELRQSFHQMKSSQTDSQNKRLMQERLQNDEKEEMEAKISELTQRLEKKGQENANLNKQLQTSKSHVFNLERELEVLKLQSEAACLVKDEVGSLNKELLLMGELQQKYQQRLADSSVKHHANKQTLMLLESCRNENNELALKLEQTSLQFEASKAVAHDLEEQVKTKDSLLVKQKAIIEALKAQTQAKLKAVESKYQCQKSIEAALHAEVLHLHHQMALLQKPSNPLAPESSAAAAAASSGPLETPVPVDEVQSSLVEEGAVASSPMNSDTEVAMEACSDPADSN
ncbi:hypothetical protein CAPTEDRAFT_219242 [Capitella teleta]|uniref:Hamartin n=1 Tax=Capitella teleta TaxID=283909 RepID=R7V2X5_CAPTE|nr:hypothetical protein CAPTEDRAFT_219242 [Capitella teleta]|eukprot:ELU12842.1 hypothetical protein CAPTEDRAFT_219242 [Capitella teleta]